MANMVVLLDELVDGGIPGDAVKLPPPATPGKVLYASWGREQVIYTQEKLF